MKEIDMRKGKNNHGHKFRGLAISAKVRDSYKIKLNSRNQTKMKCGNNDKASRKSAHSNLEN